jgi:hypothetical protein
MAVRSWITHLSDRAFFVSKPKVNEKSVEVAAVRWDCDVCRWFDLTASWNLHSQDAHHLEAPTGTV